MSTRSHLPPQEVLSSASMAGNLTSTPTILQSLTKVSYQVSWSGSTPVGTITIQGSNDYKLNPNGTVMNTGTWTTFTFSVNGSVSSSLPVSGNTGNGIADIETGVNAIRLVYTAGSGTGTLTAVVTAKVD